MRGALIAFFAGLVIGGAIASFVLIRSKRREMKSFREENNQLRTSFRVARKEVASLGIDIVRERELCGNYMRDVKRLQQSNEKTLESVKLRVDLRDKKIKQLEKILVDNKLLPRSYENGGE